MKGTSYLRVSTNEQGLGLEAQRDAIRAYCAREGVEIVGEHVDEGISGAAPLDRRPGLLDAVASLRRGRILVVAKRDRLARDAFVALLVEREAEKRGARVICADGNGNGEGAADVLLRRMLDAVAEFERAQIALRTRAALHVKRMRGERISGRPPFGYRFAGGSLEREPAEHAILARMLSMRADGSGPEGIARALGAEGAANPRTGTSRWSRQLVHKILATSARRVAAR